MIDRAIREIRIVRRRNRTWRIIQFAIVIVVTVIALMNVFVWQYVVTGITSATLILVGFMYFITFLECFNYYHYNCPVCGMEFKTSDFEIHFSRTCDNCNHHFRINFTDRE